MPFAVSNQTIAAAGTLEDSFVAPTASRPNDFTPLNPSVVNVVNVGIAPPAPTTGTLATTIEYAQGIVSESVAEYGVQETPVVITLLETLEDAALLAEYLIRSAPAFWFGNIQIIMNGLTDAQRTIINSLDIGSQVSVTKTFPKSTPSTVTQLMALEGISHDITPDRHIVTLYPNPARIYTYFIVAGYPVVATRTNLIPNPSFEVDTTGWSGNSGATVSRSTVYQYFGSACMLITSSATSFNGAALNLNRVNVVAGQTYYLSSYVRNISGDTRNVYIGIQWYNAAGVYLSEVNSFAQGSLSVAAGWVRRSATGVAPATAASANIFVVTGPTGLSAGWQTAADGILFEQTSSVLPYFDGTYVDNYTGYGLNSKAWNGTANASTSTATWYQGATRTNLVTNPSVEVSTSGWASGGTLTQSSTFAYSGTYSARAEITSAVTTDTNAGNLAGVIAGQTYTFSVYVRSSIARSFRVYISWLNGASFISNTIGTTSTTSTTGFTRFTVTGVAPATANGARPTMQVLSPSIGDLIYLDGLLFEQAASALPYFDGTYADTYAGYTLQSQSWSGTADASSSTAIWGLTSAFVGSQLDDDTKGLG